ncbi:MAG: hypothetical protein COB61_004245 [Thiotrichales bacterium]|nr:hypothetical protein [Thiotrichales bacterium]
MTIVVVNQAGGADFANLQTAINAAPATLTEPYEIHLVPGTYAGDIVIPARVGESFNNFIKITHTPGNAADAFGGGSGAHILGNSGGHANTINGGFVWYQGVAVTLDSISGASDEAFRVNNNRLLIQACFIEATNNHIQQDGVYFGSGNSKTVTLVNTVIRKFGRAAIHIQKTVQTVAGDYTIESYHNTIVDCGINLDIGVASRAVGSVIFDTSISNAGSLIPSDLNATFTGYNNVVANVLGFHNGIQADAVDTTAMELRNFSRSTAIVSPGTISWAGRGNSSQQDASVESKLGALNNYGLASLVDVVPVSGENILVSDYANGDFSVAGENAFTVTQFGVQIPAPSDPRVDLTVDITGLSRPPIGTIGAFQADIAPADGDAPIITNKGTAPTTATIGVAYTHTVTASDADSNFADLIYSIVAAPPGAAIDAATGEFTYTPTAPGGFDYTIAVSDELGLSDQETIIITVADSILPSNITDLVAVGVSPTDIRLTFTAPGDDGNVGAAASYQMRYSSTPIFTLDAWDNATVLVNSFVPQLPGTAESLIVNELSGGGQLHFNVRAVDDADNLAALSNASPDAAFLLPLTPGNLQSVVNGPDTIIHAWNPVPGASAYRLRGSASSPVTAGDPIIADNIQDTTYTETGLDANVTVYRAVSAITNNN